MKTLAFACLLMACLLSSPVAAQEDTVRDREAPITLDFVKKDIETVLHYISLRSGLSFIIQGNLKLEVTVFLKDIKPIDAVRAVCDTYGLRLVEDDDFYIVARHTDPDALLTVEFDDAPLKDVAIKLGNLSGLDIRVPSDAKATVTLAVTDQTAVQILRSICDLLDMRLVGANKLLRAGSIVDVRPNLANTPEEDLRLELQHAKSDQYSLDIRRKITTVAREGANQEGDEAAVAEFDRELERLDGFIKALAAEIAEIEAELAKRKQD